MLVVACSTEVAWREGREVFEVRGVDIALSEGVGLIIYAKMKRNRLQPRSRLSEAIGVVSALAIQLQSRSQPPSVCRQKCTSDGSCGFVRHHGVGKEAD